MKGRKTISLVCCPIFDAAIMLTFRSIEEETQQDRRGDQISGYSSWKASGTSNYHGRGRRCDQCKGVGQQVAEQFQASKSIRKLIASTFLRLKFHWGPGYGRNGVLEAQRQFNMVSA